MIDRYLNNWVEVEGNSIPKSLDLTSSRVYGYITRNVQEYIREDGTKSYKWEEYKCDKAIARILYNQISEIERLNDIEDTITNIIGNGDATLEEVMITLNNLIERLNSISNITTTTESTTNDATVLETNVEEEPTIEEGE